MVKARDTAVALVTLLLVMGCAPLSYPGARYFSDAEAAAFEECAHERSDAGHVWRCGAGRFIDARRGDFADSEALVTALGATHPSLSRPAFMKSDATDLDGERVRLTMLGYDTGIAIVITELQRRPDGRVVTCSLDGNPTTLASEAPRWCKGRIDALWRTL